MSLMGWQTGHRIGVSEIVLSVKGKSDVLQLVDIFGLGHRRCRGAGGNARPVHKLFTTACSR